MLSQAEDLTGRFCAEIAKAPPPLKAPQPQSCLDAASIWFSIDLQEVAAPAFETLAQEELWDMLRTVGVEGIYLKGMKTGGEFRTAIGLDPKWGNGWDELGSMLQKKGLALIGDTMGNSTGLGADFFAALKNKERGLYHLIEIEKRDWKLLPETGPSTSFANVPWLTLQELQKKGYVPEQFTPYVKESAWNATGKVCCDDGVVRRWIYLQSNGTDPALDWLNGSFAACRIAAGDLIDSVFCVGQKIVKIDAKIQDSAKETLALWIRKLGSFSVLETAGGIDELKKSSTDLMCDIATRPALLHAIIAEDAEALRLMYQLFLDEGIEMKRLVHTLQPFDQFVCDWSELATHPRRRFPYYEEVLTGDALRNRLLKEDLLRLGGPPNGTWPALCMRAFGQRADITKVHLLLALFYAMQPGVFSFSASDLLGTLKEQPLNLTGPNEGTIYPSLPAQMQNGQSFAMQLRNILSARKESGIESGELVSIPRTKDKGLLILVFRLRNGMTQLSALNFGSAPVQQTIDLPSIRQTTAIDLISGQSMAKPLDSSQIRLDLPPLSGKMIRFQTKYYP
jgi:hypothetical protein